jgi:DNA invertase Pin-like site-specific DNA recombinase
MSTRIALYARVSTNDRDQNPETQLMALRQWVQDGDATVTEWIDQASAVDLVHRTAWRELLDACRRRQVDQVVVWRLDRAFRSVLDAAQTLERLRAWKVDIKSYQEPWLDTSSPFGEAMFHITAAYAQLERGILSERVKAGMARARTQGVRLGRAPRTEETRFCREWAVVRPQVVAGTLSRRAAARRLGCGETTVRRLLAADGAQHKGGAQ